MTQQDIEDCKLMVKRCEDILSLTPIENKEMRDWFEFARDYYNGPLLVQNLNTLIINVSEIMKNK